MKKIILFIMMLSINIAYTQNWTQLGLDIDGESSADQSGYSVSISADGGTMAIGAIYNNGNGTYAGHVRVYSWNGTAWVQKGADIDGEAASDWSGFSVSLSADGETLAIGAPYNDETGASAGHVRVYSWNGTAWVQKGADIDGEAYNDQSGSSVSLSTNGETLAIGAPNNDGTAPDAGHVRVYSWNGTTWVQKGLDIDGEAVGDQSGRSISLSSDGENLAIGARFNDGTAPDAGHVRVYSWNGTAWVQKGADIDGEAYLDQSGSSVSLSTNGETLAIGAHANDGTATNAGHVRVYSWNGTAWIQKGADIDGEAYNDQSGLSVSISADGETLAIGARYNDGTATHAGHVRIYSWNGTAWIQKGLDIDGEAASDQSGHSVSVSADGETLAIGAPNNDGNGSYAGHVRVYEFSTPCTNPTTPTVTASATCAGDSTILNISGTLNDATAWHIYTGSCGGTAVGTTTTGTFTTGALTANTTFYVRGEGACVTPASCGSVAVTVSSLPVVAFDPCTWTLHTKDLNANTWQGGFLELSINGGPIDTFVHPSNSTNENTYPLNITTGGTIDQTFTGGNWTWEVNWWITDDNGNVVFGTPNVANYPATGVAPGNISCQSGCPQQQLATYCNTSSNQVCINGGIQSGLSVASPQGGVYSGVGVTDGGDGMSYTFDPSAAGLGLETITYTYNNAGCLNSDSFDVTVHNLDDASFSYGSAAYCSNIADPSPIINGAASGTFSSTSGLVINTYSGELDLSASTPGTYTVTYTTTGFCPNSSTKDVTITYCAGIITWTGATDTDWSVATNWLGGVVPTSANEVIIPDVSSASGNFPIITTAITVGKVTVDASASLTVVEGIILGNLFTNNGTVTLKDGAYLDDFTYPSASFPGNLIVETTAANGVSNDQRFISSPINTPAFSEIADDLNGPWGAGAQGSNGVAVTVDDCSLPTLTSSSNYGNLFEYNEALITSSSQCELEGWVVRSSGALANAKGYSAYLTNGSTFDFSGTPNTGSIAINATNTGSSHTTAEGWNLLGNPYPSAINRNAVITAGATDVQYFVTSGIYQGSYSAYNPGTNIAISQGFQAHVASTGNITFNDAMRTTGAATWYENENWFEHKLEISVLGADYADKTTLFYNNEATNNYEPMFDVRKRKSEAGHPTLSTFGGNLDLTLNGLSVNDLGQTIPMNLESGTNGTFTLSFEGMETFPTNTPIYIKDIQENVIHNIADGDYTFTATTNDDIARFEIIFVPEVSLTTTHVDCEGNAGSVMLSNTNFATGRTFEIMENNMIIASNDLTNLNESLTAGTYTLNVNDPYGGTQVYPITIESTEAIEAAFTVSNTELAIGEILLLNNTTVNSNTVNWTINNATITNVNNATYTFDEAGIYEVVMHVANDKCSAVKTETITVSNKATAIRTINGERISFYPNPVTNVLHIDFDQEINIKIVDYIGKTVVKTSAKTIDLSDIAAGIYFLEIADANNKLIVSEKIMKK